MHSGCHYDRASDAMQGLPLGYEFGHGCRPIQSKGDSLLGLAQPQDGIQSSVKQMVKVVRVLGCAGNIY